MDRPEGEAEENGTFGLGGIAILLIIPDGNAKTKSPVVFPLLIMPEPNKTTTVPTVMAGLVKEALEPSAKLLGIELRDKIKEVLDAAKENRRSENLRKHIAAVRESLPNPPSGETSYEQLELFNSWAEGAQDVDEQEPDLTRMWRKLLHDIVQGRHVSKDLVSVLRQVDAPMAKLLIALGQNQDSSWVEMRNALNLPETDDAVEEVRFQIKRLESLGLVDNDHKKKFGWTVFFAVPTFGIIGSLFPSIMTNIRWILMGEIQPDLQFVKSLAAQVVLAIAGLTLVAWLVRQTYKYPTILVTWKGRALVNYASQIRAEEVVKPGIR